MHTCAKIKKRSIERINRAKRLRLYAVIRAVSPLDVIF